MGHTLVILGDVAFEQDAVLSMNTDLLFAHAVRIREWRGVRTKRYCCARHLDGEVLLFDLENDPLETDNLAEKPEWRELRDQLEKRMGELMALRHDTFLTNAECQDWFDEEKRIVKNALGPLGDPKAEPDWSLLE